MTASSFCQWVNESLLPNEGLELGYPRRVSVDTARKWLHELGCSVLDQKKGVYIDGHGERMLWNTEKNLFGSSLLLGFINKANAPSEEAAKVFQMI